MEGLSSQRDIIQGIKAFAQKHHLHITVYASHRNERHEMLSVADYALIEPKDSENKLPFILDTIARFGINVIHTGRNSLWFEKHRAEIESTGAVLITGSTDAGRLEIAEDKVAFAQLMAQHQLPVVPSWHVKNSDELKHYLASPPFAHGQMCVKPVTGIYGMGFWRFDDTVSPVEVFTHPENRIVHPAFYLAALTQSTPFIPLVLMPWLPGPEYSVDILADNGDVLVGVARRKDGVVQYLENAGEAFELACACARAMRADGLINVQLRNDHHDRPVLLETNMRPSGGIGFTRHSGINLAGLFAAWKLGLMAKDDVIKHANATFSPAVVRLVTDVIAYPKALTNQLN